MRLHLALLGVLKRTVLDLSITILLQQSRGTFLVANISEQIVNTWFLKYRFCTVFLTNEIASMKGSVFAV